MRLGNRVTAATIVLVVATATAFGAVAYVLIGRTVLPFELDAIRGHAQDVASSLADAVRPAVTDALLLGSLPAASRILSDDSTDEEGRAEFVEYLTALLRSHPEYLQARLIGAADGGREVVRVERAPDGAVRVVPEPELQQKGERAYFRAAMAVSPGEVYGSPIELNREHGVVQDPPVPVARFATSIPDRSGAPAGIAILNVDLRGPLARARIATHERGEVVVVGGDDTFLVQPDRELEFIPGAATGDVFPMEAVRTAGADRSAVEVMSPEGVCLVAGVATMELPSGRRLTVVETVPLTVASATTGAVWRSSLLAGIVATLVAIVLSIVIARALTRPLSRLQAAIDRYPESDFQGVDAGPEEVRELGASFGSMVRRVERNETRLREELEARQRAEEELSRHLDRVRLLASALESASDAVVLKSLDGTVIHCNAAAERLYGYPASELVGGSIDKDR
ncbi:MAG: PAS domain S-box protein, partial [Planctomycetota bacterium JB042]